MRKLVAAMALTVMACGGGDSEVRAQALATVGADPTAVETPAVHEVQMVLNDAGEYRFVPDELTIKTGDTVRWINVSAVAAASGASLIVRGAALCCGARIVGLEDR